MIANTKYLSQVMFSIICLTSVNSCLAQKSNEFSIRLYKPDDRQGVTPRGDEIILDGKKIESSRFGAGIGLVAIPLGEHSAVIQLTGYRRCVIAFSSNGTATELLDIPIKIEEIGAPESPSCRLTISEKDTRIEAVFSGCRPIGGHCE